MGKLESFTITSNRGLPGRVVNPRSWLQRRPLLAFFGLAYGISWACIALILSATGFDLSNLRPLDTGLIFVAMLLGPSVGGLIMTAHLEGRAGLRSLWLSLARWQVEGRWVALALLLMPALLLAVLLPLAAFYDPAFAPGFQWQLFAIGLAAGSFEELGWTGFATPRLLARQRLFRAGLSLGLLWALWHVLVDFRQNFSTMNLAWLLEFAVFYLAALSAYRVLMTWVYANTRSLPLAMLMHASYTGWLMVLYPATSFEQGLIWQTAFAAVLWIAVALVIGLYVNGPARWAKLVRAHLNELDAGSIDAAGRQPSPARFEARELEGLPAPVHRYFQTVLVDGPPSIAAVNIEMTGTINMSATAEQWKTFTSGQRAVTRKPGFLWNARVDMFPGVPAQVEDSYIAGQGRLNAKVFGLFAVADLHGGGEIARGEFMRYFAESPWYPTALLPSQGVRWETVDETSANATIADGPITLTLLFRFSAAGFIASVHAEARGASVGKDGAMVMLPWECKLSDYSPHDGMLVPMRGEVAWMRPEGRKPYFVGNVKELAYEFLP